VALSDAASDPHDALALIQEAIRIDPYNEDLYQRAMHRYARLGNGDGIRRTLRALAQRLSELEVQPSPQTQRIATELIARLDARTRSHQHSA
jgi:DNA-binding SARP family transcriptional activator